MYAVSDGRTEAQFTRVRTNICTDEVCSRTACLHGSVQILLQWCLHGSVQAKFRPVVAFDCRPGITALPEQKVARFGCLHESVQIWNRAGQTVDLLFSGPKLAHLGPVYTGPGKSLNGQKLAQFHLAFITRHRRNWKNFWTAKCASLGPEKSRSTFWPARFHICTDSCKHPNRVTFCSDSAVMACNQMPQLV